MASSILGIPPLISSQLLCQLGLFGRSGSGQLLHLVGNGLCRIEGRIEVPLVKVLLCALDRVFHALGLIGNVLHHFALGGIVGILRPL